MIKTIHHMMCNTYNVQLPHELLHGQDVRIKEQTTRDDPPSLSRQCTGAGHEVVERRVQRICRNRSGHIVGHQQLLRTQWPACTVQQCCTSTSQVSAQINMWGRVVDQVSTVKSMLCCTGLKAWCVRYCTT